MMVTDTIDGVHPADSPSGETWVPVQSRELIAALAWTVLADLLIFRTQGFAGPAVFLLGVPLCFCLALPDAMKRVAMGIVTVGMIAVAFRLVWQGSALAIVSGIMLVIAVSMAAAGAMPLVFGRLGFGLLGSVQRCGSLEAFPCSVCGSTSGPNAQWNIGLGNPHVDCDRLRINLRVCQS